MQENSFHTVTHIDQMHAEPNKGVLYKNQSIDSTDRRWREGTFVLLPDRKIFE